MGVILRVGKRNAQKHQEQCRLLIKLEGSKM
jgi:hypothetical protein